MATRQQSLAMLMLVALAFTLSTMSALRFGDLPLGVGELILIGCLIVHLPLGHGLHAGNVPNRFVPMLLLLLLAMLPGYIVTLLEEGTVPYVTYNLVASVWVVLLFAYLHFGFDHGRGEIEQLARFFLVFSTLYFAVVFALAWFEPAMVYREDADRLLEVTGADPFAERTFRLVGFSLNPNQLALHALIASFFALTSWKRNGTFASLVCLGLAATAGIMSQSDAFLIAEIGLVGVWIVMGIVFRGSVISGMIVLMVAAVAAGVLFNPVLQAVQEISNTDGQGAGRLTLWENGMLAGLERPFIGLGPGSWSGFDGPKQLEEAHNSAVDYFSNAGLLGITLMLIGMVTLLYRSLVSRHAAMLAGASAIILFAMFHNVLRQPIMWLGLYYVAQNVWPNARRAALRTSGRSSGRSSGRRRRRVYVSDGGRQPVRG